MEVDQAFESKYPYITRFVEEQGRIEIGYQDMIDAFVIAYDEGGTIYEGKSSYPSLDIALEDLERGIKEFIEEMVFGNKI